MKKKPVSPSNAAELRRQAEAIIDKRRKTRTAIPATEDESKRLVHELQVHQIELEMQNEELLHSRVQVEAGLRQFTELYDFAPVGYFTLARDGAIHHVNLTGARLFNLERSHLIKRRFGLFIPAGLRSAFNAFLSKVFESASTETCETEIQNDRSSPLHVHIEATASQEGHECYAVVMDVTKHKLVENALHDSEERFRSLYENSTIGLYRTDPEGNIHLANPALITMLGYQSLNELRERKLSMEGFDPEYPRAMFIERIERQGELKGLESAWRRRDGRVIFVRESARAIRDKHGKTLYYDGTVEDITDRKQAEETLKETERVKSTLLDKMNEAQHIAMIGSWELNLQTHQVWWSDETYRIFGVTPQEYVPSVEANSRFFHPSDAGRFSRSFEHTIQTGEPLNIEFRLMSGDGLLKHCLGKGKILYDAAGKPVLFRGTIMDISERKRAEVILEKSEQRHRDIFAFAPVGIYQSTIEGDFVLVNAKLAEILGYDSIAELMQKNLTRDVFFKEEERDAQIATSERVGSVKNLELQWKKKDGSLIWISLNAHIVKGIAETRAYIEGFVQDITERKRAELESRVLLEITQGITTTVNLDELFRLIHGSLKKILYADNCFIALHDRATGQFSFPYFVDRFDTTPSPQRLKKSCAAYVFRTGLPLLITRKDFEQLEQQGEVEHVGTPSPEWLGVPLRTPSKIIGVLVVQQYEDKPTYTKRDLEFLVSVGNQIALVIERKQAEQELNTLAHALRSVGECVSITDMDDVILFTNEAFLKTYGYEEEELQGKRVSIVRSSTTPSEVMREIHPATLRGGWRGEIMNRRKDGSEFPVFLSTSIIRDEKGEPIALIGVATDITEIKIREQKQKSLEAQLMQVQKLESLGTLASGIAHDFNNILGIIIGHASLLENLPPDSSGIKKSVDAITKAGTRGAALVKQLLTFARKTDIIVEPVQMNTIVIEVIKLIDETFPKSITISLELEKRLPEIRADATQIHQVLLNLCVNARDAMPNGGMLSLGTSVVAGELIRTRFIKAGAREYNCLRVTDTGIGMDDATRQRIFEPFFTTKGVGKGTGLGLSSVFGIVESHNGFIDIRSAPGKGTTFEVYLPLPAESIKIGEVKEQSLGEIIGGHETILLIEDEELLRDLVKGVLKSKGYSVLTAEDGNEGVEHYTRHQQDIQLVLSDLGLPKLNGFETFKRIKSINPRVKFILATGYVDPEEKSIMLVAGVSNIIHKPYSIDQMLRSVRSILDLTKD